MKTKNILFASALIVFQHCLWGQGEEVVYDSPSNSFISLSLQTHKNKLRFGTQDEYYIKADGTYVKPQDSNYYDVDKRMSHNMASKYAFVELLKIRYKEDMFSVMDRSLFTERKQNMYDKEQKSYTAQQQVLALANALSTKMELKRFFCNEKGEDCASTFKEDGYYNEPRNIRTWGGRGASEFQQLRAYTTFVNELFPKLQQWGNSLHPTNKIDGYFVAKAQLGKYDFKDGGYWLDTNQFYQNGFLLRWRGLQPINTSERKLMHPNGTSILYKMSPEEAETFSEKYKHIFLVLDVMASLDGMENYRADHLKTTYTLNSPVIEIYSDDGLTNKVGEINIETMVYKTR
ncbi:hypothetical protein [Flagellimonas nanhaiensis]|uniref:Uncharacterized protein n=1 Tax=Flagellimonas nanhaiensis TaxID=2292706 RepID=A0A371JRT1_9FLAO|nr:hypothetical protein [Allomuricauda nanhaiensis]RDY60205.1 hypothetical protein DX873_12835 [Allomuricauda nanhaiensis]